MHCGILDHYIVHVLVHPVLKLGRITCATSTVERMHDSRLGVKSNPHELRRGVMAWKSYSS